MHFDNIIAYLDHRDKFIDHQLFGSAENHRDLLIITHIGDE